MHIFDIHIMAVLVLIGTWAITCLCVRVARPLGLIDVPNHRSSHSSPTPRAGGIGFVLMLNAVLAVAASLNLLPASIAIALSGGLIVAAVGLWDDRWQLSASVRFIAHLMAGAWALLWLGFGRTIGTIPGHPYLTAALFGVFLVSFAWCINLTNFMDGIDGITGSEIVCVGLVCSLISQLRLLGTAADLWLLLAAAAAGFLLLNWHPARIFMGDVGSGYLGFAVAAIGAVQVSQNPATAWTPLIMMSVFVTDATATLLRRFVNGEKWYAPHRSHAFQVAADNWGHRAVVKAVIGINLFWLAPLALVAAMQPSFGPVLWIIALVPLTAVQFRMTRHFSSAARSSSEPEPAI